MHQIRMNTFQKHTHTFNQSGFLGYKVPIFSFNWRFINLFLYIFRIFLIFFLWKTSLVHISSRKFYCISINFLLYTNFHWEEFSIFKNALMISIISTGFPSDGCNFSGKTERESESVFWMIPLLRFLLRLCG